MYILYYNGMPWLADDSAQVRGAEKPSPGEQECRPPPPGHGTPRADFFSDFSNVERMTL